MNGDFKTGYQTPGTAYGEDLIMEIPGMERTIERIKNIDQNKVNCLSSLICLPFAFCNPKAGLALILKTGEAS